MKTAAWIVVMVALFPVGLSGQQPESQSATPQTQNPTLPPSSPGPEMSVGGIPACPEHFEDSLESDGIVGKDTDGVTPPKALHIEDGKFSNEARREIDAARIKKFEGSSLVGIVVGTDGKPRDLCLRKSVGFALDVQAVKAVQKFTFLPARKDGKPVSMRLTVEVTFKRW